MFELPLFPLNTVLFPGMPLPLHIFEDRYKQMIRICLDARQPFGVVLIRQGVEALGPLAEPYSVGCTAQIMHTRSLSQGRMNIIALGRERFRILSLDTKVAPYLIGNVELFPLANPDPAETARAGERLRPWVLRYLQVLIQTGETKFKSQKIPDDPISLAYLAAVILQVPIPEKQAFLAEEAAVELLSRICHAYRREIALMRKMLSIGGREIGGHFSVN